MELKDYKYRVAVVRVDKEHIEKQQKQGNIEKENWKQTLCQSIWPTCSLGCPCKVFNISIDARVTLFVMLSKLNLYQRILPYKYFGS